MSEKKESIGAFWINESQSGKKYLSGSVTVNGVTQKVVVFKNDYKQEDKHPDYRVYESTPKGEQSQAAPSKGFEDDVPF